MKKILALCCLLTLLSGCFDSDTPAFAGKTYQLLEAQNGAEVILGFAADEPRFYGSVVNNYFGNYKTDGNKITFGDAGSTMMMGPREEMEAERNYLQILPRVVSYKMVGTNLVLITNNGQELGFKKIATPQQ